MKTVVLLMLVGLVVDSSYALFFSEDETQPSEDKNKLTRETSHRTGNYIVSQYFGDNDYEGIKDSGENKNSDDNADIDDDVKNPESEQLALEKSVNDFKMDRSHDNWAKKVSDPFRRPRSRRQGGRRRRRRQDKSRVILATVKKDCSD